MAGNRHARELCRRSHIEGTTAGERNGRSRQPRSRLAGAGPEPAASGETWRRDGSAVRLRRQCLKTATTSSSSARARAAGRGAAAGADRQAHPAARARRLPAARARELGHQAVFVEAATRRAKPGSRSNGDSFHPGLHYFVGGNSKVYGAALLRLRERDFGEVRHVDGVSPAWPLEYDVFEPYYSQAEELFHVHGARGEDPTEPPASAPYAIRRSRHEPRIQALCRRA